MDRIILRIGSQKKEFFLVTSFRISIGEKIRLYHRGTDADDVWSSPGDGDLPHSGICVDAFEVLGANNEVIFQAVLNLNAYFKET